MTLMHCHTPLEFAGQQTELLSERGAEVAGVKRTKH